MSIVKTFVVTNKNDFPFWFNERTENGLAKVNYDDEGNILTIMVFSPTKTLTAVPGDVIMLMKTGLTVIKGEAAKKYKVIENGKKEK